MCFAGRLAGSQTDAAFPLQAPAVKGVTTKSGTLKIEFHDKIAALTQMAKSSA